MDSYLLSRESCSRGSVKIYRSIACMSRFVRVCLDWFVHMLRRCGSHVYRWVSTHAFRGSRKQGIRLFVVLFDPFLDAKMTLQLYCDVEKLAH